MRERIGAYVSGAAHLGVILWLLVAGALFRPNATKDLRVTNVSLISSAQFSAMQSKVPAVETSLVAPTSPTLAAPAPVVPRSQKAPKRSPASAKPLQPAPPAPKPDVSAPDSAPKAEVAPSAPVTLLPPALENSAAHVGKSDAPPTPQPEPRIARIAAPAPAPEVKTAPVVRKATTPVSTPVAKPLRVVPATAPKAAAPRIVTQAEQVSRAPKRSVRPKARPARRASASRTPTPPPAASGANTMAAAIAAAVSQANSSPAAPPRVPLEPPLSAAVKDGLRVAVGRCWNVGTNSTAALQVTVTVGVSMTEDGHPKMGTIRMLSFTGGSRASALQAFDAARRAIIICGRTGYALPRAKYAQWRNIEMVFDPQKMRIK